MEKHASCTSMVVGKLASTDGSIMIARNEDCKAAWPKRMVIHPAGDLPTDYLCKETKLKLKLPAHSAKYTATPEWTDKYGTYEEDGINEYHVAMSATETTASNQLVLGYDPLVKKGLNEEAMLTVVLPFVKTAREGVQRLGDLIAKYGTGESNGILFADDNEAWYFENGSGHYWVAQRIPDDSYAVIANQISIQEIDFADSDNFMFHPDIRSFVEEHHLNPEPDHFNFRKIFGTNERFDAGYNTPRVWYGHHMFNPIQNQDEDPESAELPMLMKPEHKLSVLDVQRYLQSHYQGTPYDPVGILGDDRSRHLYRPVSLAKTQESHILQMNRPNSNDIHWLSMGVPSESVFVPFFADIDDIPVQYKRGRLPASLTSAYWIYKQTSVLVDSHYHEFMPLLKDVQNKLISESLGVVDKADQEAPKLQGQKRIDYLTDASMEFAKKALHEYQALAVQLIEKMTDYCELVYNPRETL